MTHFGNGNLLTRELLSYTQFSLVIFYIQTFKLLKNNTIQSLGLWGVCILIKRPELFWDCNNFDQGAIRMACCCFGYFLYDSIDLIQQVGIVKSYDLLIHHAIVFGKLFKAFFILFRIFLLKLFNFFRKSDLFGVSRRVSRRHCYGPLCRARKRDATYTNDSQNVRASSWKFEVTKNSFMTNRQIFAGFSVEQCQALVI